MKNIYLLFVIFFIPILSLSERLFSNEPKQFVQLRQDGSELKGYLSFPLDRESFPIAILCQGSYSEECSTQSVYPFHQILAPLFNSAGIGILSVEKKGVDREHFDAAVTDGTFRIVSLRIELFPQPGIPTKMIVFIHPQ